MKNTLTWIGAVLAVLIFIIASMAVTCLLTYIVCLCFNLPFSVKAGIGVWIILIVLGSLFDNKRINN